MSFDKNVNIIYEIYLVRYNLGRYCMSNKLSGTVENTGLIKKH